MTKIFAAQTLLAFMVGVFAFGCGGGSATDQGPLELKAVTVGEKNELFEVTGPGSIRLAPGVRVRKVAGPGGKG